jgi:hypothetical protein
MSGAPVVSLLETVIHSAPGATTFGRTTLFLSGARGGDEFQLALPTGATLLQTETGTLSLEIRLVDDHTVLGKRPAGARRASGRVVVDWQRSADAALEVEEPFPRLAGIAPVREFVVVVPPRRADYLPRHAQPLLDREVYLLERSEQLLELIGGHADLAGELPASLLEDLTRDLDAQLRALAGVSWDSPALRRQYDRACARWDSLRAADWIASVAAQPDADASLEQFSAALLAAERAVVLQSGDAASPVATFWRVDRRQARLALAGALLAGLWLGWATLTFARRRVALRQPADVDPPAYAGLMLLGVIWWLWLIWSPFGLILVAAGGLLQLARLARARAA